MKPGRLLIGLALALSGCKAEPARQEGPGPTEASSEAAPFYLAVMAQSLEAYPEAGIRGALRRGDS